MEKEEVSVSDYESVDFITDKTREGLLVLYGFLEGLNGKPIGQSAFGGAERIYVPEEMRSALKMLLWPNPVVKEEKDE